MLRCLAAGVMLILSGCASTNTAHQGPATHPRIAPASAGTCNLAKNSPYGLAIVSATLPPRPRGYVLDYPQWFSYTYDRKGSSALTRVFTEKTLTVAKLIFYVPIRSDFSGLFGKLFILRLRAGTYQFTKWVSGAVLLRWRPLYLKPLTFNVAAGGLVYLGSFDPVLVDGKNIFGQKSVTSWISIRDDYSRDISVFHEMCPQIDPQRIAVQVMNPAPWHPPRQ